MIRSLRKLRMTAAEIAELLAIPLSTVSLWLKRIGLGKRSLDPRSEPVRRGCPGRIQREPREMQRSLASRTVYKTALKLTP